MPNVPDMPRFLCRLLTCAAFCLPAAAQTPLPESVRAALARAQLPEDSLYAWVAPIEGGPATLAHQPSALAHPASVMKLVTSMAALERLGPLFQWHTPVSTDGRHLYVQGRGDPRWVNERLWGLLRQVMAVTGPVLAGDLVLDRSAYAIPAVEAGAFDGEPLKPYNVRPDALMVNQKSVLLTFRPDPARGVARVGSDTPLAGVQWPATVPLGEGACEDWRAGLQLDATDPTRPRFAGTLPARCGDKVWPLAYADPASFNARAIEAQWRALGGRLQGRVREGRVPGGTTLVVEGLSPTLPDVLRDMNKHSNNVIAQHLMLALSPGQPAQPANWEGARAEVQALVQSQGCRDDELVIDNGSGLSRQERISPRCLGRLLQWAWTRPWMPELLSSLPVAGIETTARRVPSVAGRAHLKTGSLANVAALAGVVHGEDGRRHAVVVMLNHPLATGAEARAVLDAVVGATAGAEAVRTGCCGRD
ncbi:D-alanyl-D-alanine carboxypeptidase/D-alanyl-D-alanine endopeptidase [Sphaerotilus sp.]|jgi:serine-type D-Ala-D-Ala carboxypeptidase/endopeptidase (penicillin-binding protein 4)|uniref:D-alanyl-D-alanine carboxypeptidase/D-alanyl-D-alanine endopeptidase n=1 Tax=Sphaerotilus sp. TaxID=2093942 RepID=UPI0025E7C040|nr:D-alanyl-D-alanine carboxypeptidase/D-alanyl-D-alanine-endopeptidase [Sphaerotilus sp.]